LVLALGPESVTRIVSSRVNAGRALCAAILKANPRPRVLIQASAVGFYGSHGAEPVTEDLPLGRGFLAGVCRGWEASSQPVEELGVRRVVIRTGVVLSKDAGALQRLLLPYKLYAGGPFGNGRQGFPWIHPADEIAAIRFLMENDHAFGIFNLPAPQPLSNADFGAILAKVCTDLTGCPSRHLHCACCWVKCPPWFWRDSIWFPNGFKNLDTTSVLRKPNLHCGIYWWEPPIYKCTENNAP
jgi:uncharacterized protein (TIGR01777 family)